MSVHNYSELNFHVGHDVVVVNYGLQNAAIECIDCGCVLLDFDRLYCDVCGGDASYESDTGVPLCENHFNLYETNDKFAEELDAI